jgi:hypothetical protein
MDLGVDEGDGSLFDVNTTSLPNNIPQKLPGNYLQGETSRNKAMWGNVPGKVQISTQSHKLPNMGDQTSVPGNFPQRAMEKLFRERFKSRCNLTPYCGIWENTRQF